jgi:hypothetical protein
MAMAPLNTTKHHVKGRQVLEQPGHCPFMVIQKRRPFKKILRRVSGDRHLRKNNQPAAPVHGLPGAGHDLFTVYRKITNNRIYLYQPDFHLGLLPLQWIIS